MFEVKFFISKTGVTFSLNELYSVVYPRNSVSTTALGMIKEAKYAALKGVATVH